MLSWVLGFTGQVRLVAPERLRQEVAAWAGGIAGADDARSAQTDRLPASRIR